MTKETILITGATGTVGKELVKELANYDVHIRAGVHSVVKGENLKKYPDVDLCDIDFSRPETIQAAFTGVDKVFMITPFSYNQVEMGKALTDAAKACGVKHLVKLSARGAQAEPGIQLGRWHRVVEKYIEQSGLPYTHLRPSNFMQNFINYSGDSILNEGKIYMPLGSGKIPYIDARDIAAVGAKVITEEGHKGQTYDLTGPEDLSLEDVAHILSEETGKTITYVDVPEEAARHAMSQQHMPDWMVNAMMELHTIGKAGYAAGTTNHVEQITGCPARTFSRFVRDNLKCFI